MNTKQLIALADTIRRANSIPSDAQSGETVEHFTRHAIFKLADFCAASNPAFKRDRWLDYIAGKCGPNGGAI